MEIEKSFMTEIFQERYSKSSDLLVTAENNTIQYFCGNLKTGVCFVFGFFCLLVASRGSAGGC